MPYLRLLLISLLAVPLINCSPEPDCGFLISGGMRVHWNRTPIDFRISSDFSQAEMHSILSAANTINKAVNYKLINISKTQPNIFNHGDGVNSIIIHQFKDGKLGLARVSWDNAVYTEADIFLNIKGVGDLETTALHEFMHAIGIGHDESEGSIMNRFQNYKQRHLNPIDIAKITCEY